MKYGTPVFFALGALLAIVSVISPAINAVWQRPFSNGAVLAMLASLAWQVICSAVQKVDE